MLSDIHLDDFKFLEIEMIACKQSKFIINRKLYIQISIFKDTIFTFSEITGLEFWRSSNLVNK